MFFQRTKAKRTLRILAMIAVLFGISACSLFSSNQPEPSRVKLPSKEAIIIQKQISYHDLQLALGNELLTSKIRPVEVFQSANGATQNFPNFRLFDISDGSVYSLLGLANADILVAINERVVVAPQVLGQVVTILPKEKGVTFDLLREGKSTLIKVTFVNSK